MRLFWRSLWPQECSHMHQTLVLSSGASQRDWSKAPIGTVRSSVPKSRVWTDIHNFDAQGVNRCLLLARARALLAQPQAFFAMFATHNAHTLAAVRAIAGERTDYELPKDSTAWVKRFTTRPSARASSAFRVAFMRQSGRTKIYSRIWCAVCSKTAPTRRCVNRLADTREVPDRRHHRRSRRTGRSHRFFKPHPRIPLPADSSRTQELARASRSAIRRSRRRSSRASLAPSAARLSRNRSWRKFCKTDRRSRCSIPPTGGVGRGAVVTATPELALKALASAQGAQWSWDAMGGASARRSLIERPISSNGIWHVSSVCAFARRARRLRMVCPNAARLSISCAITRCLRAPSLKARPHSRADRRAQRVIATRARGFCLHQSVEFS